MTRREELMRDPILQEEFRKMKNGENTSMDKPQSLLDWYDETKKLIRRLNITEYHEQTKSEILHELLPNSAPDILIVPPFNCDYGNLIFAEEGVCINMGCIMLDGAGIYIGAKTLFGPNVHIYTAGHPLEAARRDDYIINKSVRIGEKCWIGGDVTICPGVTIGDRTVIGAGAVVVHDIPADSLAVGNPARVIRKINNNNC